MMGLSIVKVKLYFLYIDSSLYLFSEFCALLCIGGPKKKEQKKNNNKGTKRRLREESKDDESISVSRNGSFIKG